MEKYIYDVDIILCTSAFLPQPGLVTFAPELHLCKSDEIPGVPDETKIPTFDDPADEATFRTLMAHCLLIIRNLQVQVIALSDKNQRRMK
jgi:hypothetical protein